MNLRFLPIHQAAFSVSLALLIPGTSHGAEPAPPPPVDPEIPATALPSDGKPLPDFEDAEEQLLARLLEAERSYEEAVLLFRSDQPANARAAMTRAFTVVAEALEEEDLATELRADFMSMLEKVRTWEGGEPGSERPASLDVPPDELKQAPVPSIPAPPRGERHAIPIDPEDPLAKKFIHLYTKNRKSSVEEALARSGRYREMMVSALRTANLPEELFYLVMTESEYKQKALSRSGAAGLWQFMPYTARNYGLEVSYWVDERYHPEKATQAAIRYLSDLYRWFGDWHLALAAYNRGENGIGRDLKFSRSTDFDTLSKRGALPKQTSNYVPKFMACVRIGEDPEGHGLEPVYETALEFDVVKLERDLDLGIAAKCAGTTEENIRDLNPHIRAWCTPKNRKDFPLRIPKGSKDRFLQALAEVKDWNPGPQLIKYKIRSGDYLGKIARRYQTSVKSIARLNAIRNPRLIRPGMVLKIKPGKAFYTKGSNSRKSSRKQKR